MRIRPASAAGIRQAQAVVIAFVSLVPCWMLWLFASNARENHTQRIAFQEQAAITTAVVTGARTSTHGSSKRPFTVTLPTIEFVTADGRLIRTTLRYAQGFPLAEQGAWAGRKVEIRYLPDEPQSAIAADAVDRLPRATGVWPLLAFFLALVALIWYAALRLWRGGPARHSGMGG